MATHKILIDVLNVNKTIIEINNKIVNHIIKHAEVNQRNNQTNRRRVLATRNNQQQPQREMSPPFYRVDELDN